LIIEQAKDLPERLKLDTQIKRLVVLIDELSKSRSNDLST